MSLQRVDYTDPDGRLKAVMLPEEMLKDEDPSIGIPIGPPPLDNLNLPLEIEVRLNNELYHRNILTAMDALKRRPEVMNALHAALKVDVDRVLAMFLGGDYQNARAEKTIEIEKTVRSGPRPRRRR